LSNLFFHQSNIQRS